MQGPTPRELSRLRHLWRTRPVQCVLVLGAALIALYYAEENWRGKRAWEVCKSQLEAQGASVDWSDYIPAPVPDEENIFKAPMMSEWFASRTPTELGQRLGTLYVFAKQQNTNRLAVVTIVPPTTNFVASTADLVLRYCYSVLTIPPLSGTNAPTAGPGALMKRLIMEDVAVTDAIKNIARVAEIPYVMEPSVPFKDGEPQPTISSRWENLTAEQALLSILSTYDLDLVENPRTGVARIVPQDASASKVRVAIAARDQILALLDKALANSGGPAPTVLQGSQLLPLLSGPPSLARPLRFEIQSQTVPSAQEICDFFPSNAVAWVTHARARLRVEPLGTNSFSVFLGPPAFYTAAEYLAWSDQFTNAFGLIRQALQHPFARIDGDYVRPLSTPVANFSMVRMVAQTLAQRAQSWLLAVRPEQAMRELTLIHDLRRILWTGTETQSVTLVSAMIDAAVAGLYVNAIADGLRLRGWREPQLLAFERQLAEIDLPSRLARALQTERAGVCRLFEDLGPRRLVQSGLFSIDTSPPADFLAQLKSASAALLVAAPRGWIYQNMVLTARLEQHIIEVFDPVTRTIRPLSVQSLEKDFEREFAHTSAHNFMAAIATPNFSRAWQSVAQNQSRVNQALVACALERHRLARGEYPEILASLAPEFIVALPNDIISGRPLCYSRRADGTFVLYSAGWTQADASTVIEAGRAVTESVPEGAWVWQ